MAIGADDAIWKFGTQDEVTVASPSSVAADGVSTSSDVTSWTNDDDAPVAAAVLNAAWTTAPGAGETVSLYAQLEDVESTNDMPGIDANFAGIYLGDFLVDAVGSSTEQYLVLPDFPLPCVTTSQKILFFIKNYTAQSINAGWDLYITPKTPGPHS